MQEYVPEIKVCLLEKYGTIDEMTRYSRSYESAIVTRCLDTLEENFMVEERFGHGDLIAERFGHGDLIAFRIIRLLGGNR
jgi:hypothetical protein